ncbi:MAG: SRPBCC family protein [Gordonia sp. (in: high G+C Gram-positive bacteria)]
MATTRGSVEVDLSPEDTWSAVTDLSRYDEWLVLHEGWRSPVPAPDELANGTRVSSVVVVKGTRIRFDWTVNEFRPVQRVTLKGSGKGGVKAALDLTIVPAGTGSSVGFAVDLGGLPLIGPVGKAAALAVAGDVERSLIRFRDVFA